MEKRIGCSLSEADYDLFCERTVKYGLTQASFIRYALKKIMLGELQ